MIIPIKNKIYGDTSEKVFEIKYFSKKHSVCVKCRSNLLYSNSKQKEFAETIGFLLHGVCQFIIQKSFIEREFVCKLVVISIHSTNAR